MADAALVASLVQEASTRIVFIVADGLGGLPRRAGGPTELEAAVTPHLDRLMTEGVAGLCTPVAPGITPGSGAGHLALFGYDPLEHRIGRGVLDALGAGVDLAPGDVAIRANLCTLDAEGRVTDRRAGRIPSAESDRLVERLRRGVRVEGVDVVFTPVRDHRVAIRLRGPALGTAVSDTDPLVTGVPPLEPRALDTQSAATAVAAEAITRQAREILAAEPRANGLLLRGCGMAPRLTSMRERYRLTSAAVAAYPTYRGLAQLIGMSILDSGTSLADHARVIERYWSDYDFFFLHFKDPDARGEDGDFDGKVRAIEALDAIVPAVLALGPDVVVVTGDHSTPSVMRSHSFHPVPLLLWAPATARADDVTEFGERGCLRGGLGQIRARELMPIVLAHAGRLRRFGA
jgi:2,3-bisphosphoglycerate-independent phosphoglycerate mutase